MNKSFIFLALVCVFVLVATASAANNVSISFKNSNQVFATGLASIVQIKIDNIRFDTNHGVTFTMTPTADEITAHADDTVWTFQPLTVNTNPGSFPQQLIGYFDWSKNVCVETTTGKALGSIGYNSNTSFSLYLNEDGAGQFSNRFNSDDGFGTWTFECPIVFTQPAAAFNTFNVRANYESVDSAGAFTTENDDLALQPARPYFIVPDVEFKSVSLSQNKGDFFSSSSIDFSFTTNSTGHFFVSIENGPYFLAYPTQTDEKPDFWCTAGDNKFRMVYAEGSVYIVVNVATDSTINCSAFVTETDSFRTQEAEPSVSTQRTIISISHSDVTVKRAQDYVFYPGNVEAWLYQDTYNNAKYYYLYLELNNLFYSTTPLRVNSTVTFQLSEDIDVRTIDSEGSEGFRGYNCYNKNWNSVRGTLSVDSSSNTIVFADIYDSNYRYNGLYCEFYFYSGASQIYEKDRSLSVVTKVDGKSLISVESNTEKSIVHFQRPNNWNPFSSTGSADCQLVGDKLELTYRFDFNDDYTSFGYAPINPLFIFSFDGPEGYQFSQDELKDQLRCEATTATHSAFEEINLTFDEDLMAWTYKVEQVDEIEAFAIKFRCYRTELVRKQFGLLLNSASNLKVQYIDLENGNRYYEDPKVLSFSQNCYNKVAQEDPGSGSYPTNPEYRFCASGVVTLPSVDDTAIKGAVDHFKSIFEAAVAAVDETKSVSLTSWVTRQAASPYTGGTTQIALEQAEQMYDMYHTQIGHATVVQYRVNDDYTAFPEFPNYEYSSTSFSELVQKYSISAQVCYVVSKDDYALLSNYDSKIREEVWHKELVVTADKAYVPMSQQVSFNYNGQFSQVSGCGVINGLSIAPSYDAPNDKYVYTWDNYPTAQRNWKQCLLGESCQMNADCDQGAGSSLATIVCKSADGNSAKTCQMVARKQSPYVMFNSGTSAEDKSDYAFNSASSVSVVFATIVALIAFFF